MKGAILRRAVGLTFLYIGIFILLVLLQFSGMQGFSASFGRFSANGEYSKQERRARGAAAALKAVRISFAGFRISISDASPASLAIIGGNARELTLSSIEKADEGVLVKFKEGAEIRAGVERDEGGRFVLSVELPPGASELRLLYELKSARLDSKDGALLLDAGGGPYAIALSNASLGQGRLAVRPTSASLAALSMRKIAPLQPISAAVADKYVPHAPKDRALYASEIAAWRDKAWASLSSLRYDPSRVSWADADGEQRFTERALAVFCAEAVSRGSFQQAVDIAKAARERWPDRLTYVTAPFVGGLTPKMEALEAADVSEVKRLSQLVADKSPELFTKENLVHFLFDRAPLSVAQDVLRFAAEVDASRLSIRQAVGFLGCVVESHSYLKDEENPFRALAAVAETTVAGMRATASGAFLATEEDGSTDTRISLLAGTYLVEFGEEEAEPRMVAAGQDLVDGVLALADERGFIPARVLAKAGALERRAGTLAPEDVYPVVAANPYYPREVSFYRDVAPGVWAWTCAPELSVEATAAAYRFRVTFPAGRSHYMAFYGIKSFVNIQLYDIDYSADAQFEIYDASGYLYKKATRALYMKMKHKKESEEIKLFF
jgi:preprotein translocase subunit SecG